MKAFPFLLLRLTLAAVAQHASTPVPKKESTRRASGT
jgi:hypothetical protein